MIKKGGKNYSRMICLSWQVMLTCDNFKLKTNKTSTLCRLFSVNFTAANGIELTVHTVCAIRKHATEVLTFTRYVLTSLMRWAMVIALCTVLVRLLSKLLN